MVTPNKNPTAHIAQVKVIASMRAKATVCPMPGDPDASVFEA
jgi:hypothetical protein